MDGLIKVIIMFTLFLRPTNCRHVSQYHVPFPHLLMRRLINQISHNMFRKSLSLCTTYIYNIGTKLVTLTPLLSTIHQVASCHHLVSLPYLIPFGLCGPILYFYESNSLLPCQHHLFFLKPPKLVLLSSSNFL